MIFSKAKQPTGNRRGLRRCAQGPMKPVLWGWLGELARDPAFLARPRPDMGPPAAVPQDRKASPAMNPENDGVLGPRAAPGIQ